MKVNKNTETEDQINKIEALVALLTEEITKKEETISQHRDQRGRRAFNAAIRRSAKASI